MKKVMTLVLGLMILLPSLIQAQSGVEAKIGIMIKAGDKIQQMKSNDRLVRGDEIRVYVEPQSDLYTYIIYTEGEMTLLLNDPSEIKRTPGNTLVLPSTSEFYSIDVSQPKINFDVICSKEPLKNVESLFSLEGATDSENWASIVKSLSTSNLEELNDEVSNPIIMAGNVRGSEETFVKKLRKFRDDNIIVRQYEVEIKN